MTKVCMYYDNFLPNIGGVETHIENVIKGISDIQFEMVTNAIPHIQRSEYLSTNVKIQRIGPNDFRRVGMRNPGANKLMYPYKVISDLVRNKKKNDYLKSIDFNILHVHGPWLSMNLLKMDTMLKRLVLSKSTNFFKVTKPKVLTMHGLISKFTSNPFAEEYERRLVEMFSTIICVDEFILEKVRSYGREDAFLIQNSVDTNVFKYFPYTKHEKLRIGFVGRVEDELSGLKILRELVQNKPPWLDISIVGAGSEAALERFKSTIDLKKIEFHPNLNPKNIPEYLSGIDLLFNPVLTGAITRVTLEAMACGRPVIMIGKGKKGPIINNETGYLIEYNINNLMNLLDKINENKKSLIEIGKNARKKIENEFSNDAVIPKIREVYETLLH